MTPIEILVVAIVGGVLSLDAVSVTQTMVSRPIVSATLIGFLCGSPEHGLVIGAILELLAMETMPFGASRYLEWSCGAVVASVFAAKQEILTPAVLLTAVIFAILSAWLAGSSMVVLRRINGSLLASRRSELDKGNGAALGVLQAQGIALDFVRGSVVVAIAITVVLYAGRALLGGLSSPGGVSRGLVVAIPAAVALAACWRIFATATQWRIIIIAGIVVAAAISLIK